MSWVQHNHIPSQEGNRHGDHLATAFFQTDPFSFHVSTYHHEQDGRSYYYYGGSSNPGSNTEPLPTSSSHEEKARKEKKAGVAATRKPRRSPQAAPQQTANNSGSSASTCGSFGEVLKACSDCHTTKTPLWRSGPQGPRSVCNACGIRRRKARKAMAAAAAAAVAFDGEEPVPVGGSGDQHPTSALAIGTTPMAVDDDDHRSPSVLSSMPFKKRCLQFAATTCSDGKNGEEEKGSAVAASAAVHSHSSNHSKVFPQEEREAAILLMALSCGLTCR